MKKIIVAILVALITVTAAFAQPKGEQQTVLKVGATHDPHALILELVVDDLAAQGIKLEIIEFTDYVLPNTALEEGQLDANYFQHIPYLESFNNDHGYHLANAGGIHIEPLAVYSKKITDLKELKEGALIAIPNDATNEGRALRLLQSAGLITLADSSKLDSKLEDITSNPLNLKFSELEAATIPRVLQDVDAAVINGNYALSAGLSAAKDGLFIEGADSPYVNVIAVKQGNENNPAIVALVNALKSQEVKDWVAAKYPNGEVVLVF